MQKITVELANGRDDIILVTYHTNDWQWSDFAHAFEEQRALLDNAKVPVVHVIVDVTSSRIMPKGGSLVEASRNLGKEIHPKQGHTVIVGASGYIARMIDVIGHFLGKERNKIHLAKTLDAAYQMIAKITAQSEKQKV